MRWSKKDIEPDVEPSPAVIDPWLRLGAAVLLQATKQAAKGDQCAARWLSDDPLSAWVCEALGLERQLILRWLKGPRKVGGLRGRRMKQ